MKKKNLTIIIAGLAAILLLAAGYFVIEKLPENEITDIDGGDEIPDVLLPGISRDTITEIEVYNYGSLQKRVYKDSKSGEFLIEGRESNVYNDEFTALFSSVIYMNVIEKVDDPLDDSEYGLADELSPYVVNVKTSDGKGGTVYVGDLLVSGGAYYCKIAGTDDVYAVTSSIDSALHETTGYISTLLAKPIDSSKYYLMDNVTLYKDMKQFISVSFVPEEEREAGNAFGIYRMDYPAEYVPSDTNYDSLLRALTSPEADAIITLDITPENLEKYGFNTPTYELRYSLEGGQRVIYFGKKTDDGLIYVLSYDFGFIGIVGIADHFPFLEWELIDYINTTLFGMNIDNVVKISVSSKGISDSYNLSGEGSSLVVTNEKTGQTVDTHNFRQFYRTLLMTNMSGYADSTSTDDWILTFILETRGGKIYEFKFYQTSTRKCYYTVNGSGEFYVNIDEVTKIISDAGKLARGESINADSST